eukprot:CAMPEP_0185541328 /NCGR_PEP_ID=MMETSP1381-20130426/1892_1 /TAXON_ID=298111 /ORGANISM="Pavlova sp., Strain CCMP459" /LENGTH=184 /DNA_ID=CAMNT_0028153231 /DNA_START=988 /DNA_END=1543 /DNA_ORIENTATION=-
MASSSLRDSGARRRDWSRERISSGTLWSSPWGDHETASFARTPVDGLDDVDHLLLVCQGPVDLVVVTRAQVDHDMLVPEEEHDSARVVEFVHGVEVGHLRDVHEVDHRKVLHKLSYGVECLVHLHAHGVIVVAKADHYHSILLGEDGLVHRPARVEVGQEVAHRPASGAILSHPSATLPARLDT